MASRADGPKTAIQAFEAYQARKVEGQMTQLENEQLLQEDLKYVDWKVLSDKQQDPLTGLLNQAAFLKELMPGYLRRVAAANPRRRASDMEALSTRTPFAGLCIIDLRKVKTINDNVGYALGTLLIERVATVLRTAVREGSYFARLGGDEFGIMLRTMHEWTEIHFLADRLWTEYGKTDWDRLIETTQPPTLFTTFKAAVRVYPPTFDYATSVLDLSSISGCETEVQEIAAMWYQQTAEDMHVMKHGRTVPTISRGLRYDRGVLVDFELKGGMSLRAGYR